MIECSFLLTAAGQFRISTGFPFHPIIQATGHREARATIYRTKDQVNHNL
jgi:hypothetical protein